ncbi:MAG TPA: hypothetical protein VF733_01345 [Candidatus Saccharimonadales bacterium]
MSNYEHNPDFLDDIARKAQIGLLYDAKPLCSYNEIPPGGGFTIFEELDHCGEGRRDFYRSPVPESDKEGFPPQEAEWFIIDGEDSARTLWRVILHGAVTHDNTTAIKEVRQGMPFCYQGFVSFRSEEDAPPVDRFQRPTAFAKVAMPAPEQLPRPTYNTFLQRGEIVEGQDGYPLWYLPGMIFRTGLVKHVDY